MSAAVNHLAVAGIAEAFGLLVGAGVGKADLRSDWGVAGGQATGIAQVIRRADDRELLAQRRADCPLPTLSYSSAPRGGMYYQ